MHSGQDIDLSRPFSRFQIDYEEKPGRAFAVWEITAARSTNPNKSSSLILIASRLLFSVLVHEGLPGLLRPDTTVDSEPYPGIAALRW